MVSTVGALAWTSLITASFPGCRSLLQVTGILPPGYYSPVIQRHATLVPMQPLLLGQLEPRYSGSYAVEVYPDSPRTLEETRFELRCQSGERSATIEQSADRLASRQGHGVTAVWFRVPEDLARKVPATCALLWLDPSGSPFEAEVIVAKSSDA
jgi:hypothetical protein